MLRLKPKEKDRAKVLIPDDLRSALQEAWWIIRDSMRDPDVCVDYDDAIQVPPWLVGGRVGTKKRPFEFVYYVGGVRQVRWHLGLHHLEIEDIADGRTTEMLLYCCRTPDCGHKSRDPDFHCDCDYEDDPYFGHIEGADVAEALLRRGVVGLSAESTKSDIIAVLGNPKDIGGDCNHETVGFLPSWIKYYRSDCQLHFQFDRTGEKLKLLTIMEAEWVPGK